MVLKPPGRFEERRFRPTWGPVLVSNGDWRYLSPWRLTKANGRTVTTGGPLPSWLRHPVALRDTPYETRPSSSGTNACRPVR